MKFLRGIILFSFILLLCTINVKAADTGTVVIYYNDINNYPIGKKVEYTTCKVGTTYNKTAPKISGYTYIPSVSESSTYCDGEGTNIIGLVYQTDGNKKEGSVKVACYDTKGNKLSKCTDGRSGTIGTEYYIYPPTLNGYKYVRTEGANTGKFKEGSISVKFIYEATGKSDITIEKPGQEEPTTPDTKVEEKKPTSVVTTPTKKEEKKKTIVTKKQEVKTSNSKKEVEEDYIDVSFIDELETNIKNIDFKFELKNNNSNTLKYAMVGVFSSLSLGLFIVKKSIIK